MPVIENIRIQNLLQICNFIKHAINGDRNIRTFFLEKQSCFLKLGTFWKLFQKKALQILQVINMFAPSVQISNCSRIKYTRYFKNSSLVVYDSSERLNKSTDTDSEMKSSASLPLSTIPNLFNFSPVSTAQQS